MEQQPTDEVLTQKLRTAHELVQAAIRGEEIHEDRLNPKDTSPETVAYVRQIRRNGHLALDVVQVTL